MGEAVAIITAAGESRRMGAGVDKQLLSLYNKPVLEHTLTSILSASNIAGIFLVVKPREVSFFVDWSARLFGEKIKAVVPGGESRQESVRNGIKALPGDTEIVVIHDGARPFITPESVDRSIELAASRGAVSLGVPATDTIKRTDKESRTIETIPRDNLWQVQTPQVFKYDIIYRAHENAAEKGIAGTDDTSLVEALGLPVYMLQGSRSNIKITTPEDLPLAEALARTAGFDKIYEG